MKKIIVSLEKAETITLGRQGEKNSTAVMWNISQWANNFGVGRAVLLYTLEGAENAPYPCQVTIDGSWARWLITPSELMFGSRGKCQLVYVVGTETVAKSPIYMTRVQSSLGEKFSEPPESFTGWVDGVLAAGAAAEKAAGRAEEAVSQLDDTAESAAASAQAAELSKQFAVQSANNAQAAAGTAISKAEEASSSAAAAAGSKSAAEASEETAQAAAQTAQEAAETAASKAEEVAASAEAVAASAQDAKSAADKAKATVGKIKIIGVDGKTYLGAITAASGKPVFEYDEYVEAADESV